MLRQHKHKDPTFGFKGPRQGGYSGNRGLHHPLVSMSNTTHHMLCAICYIPYTSCFFPPTGPQRPSADPTRRVRLKAARRSSAKSPRPWKVIACQGSRSPIRLSTKEGTIALCGTRDHSVGSYGGPFSTERAQYPFDEEQAINHLRNLLYNLRYTPLLRGNKSE